MKRILTLLAAALLLFPAKAAAPDNNDALLPSEAQMKKAAAARHPRLLASDKEFKLYAKTVRKGGNPALERLHRNQMAVAETAASRTDHPVYKKDKSGLRILHVSRDVLKQVFACAYAWRMTKDKKYLQRVETLIRDVCGFKDWNPSHFLDTAEMAAAVAIGYDWLYSALGAETKRLAEAKLQEYALNDALKRGYLLGDNNWNQVCNAGITCASIALLDVCPELASRRITEAVASNRQGISCMYAPDGIYPEGPTYWGYGTQFEILLLTALESSFGTDFGLSGAPGFLKTGSYMLYSVSGTGKFFNYYDNGETFSSLPEVWYFASKTGDPGIAYYENKRLIEDKEVHEERLLPLFLLHAARTRGGDIPEPSGSAFSGQGATPIAIMRNGWGPDNSYLAIKAGKAGGHHGHMDAGSFVYDACGYRWASDPIKPAYDNSERGLAKYGASLWGYKSGSWRWLIAAYNNYHHNTLTVNGKLHVAEAETALLDTGATPSGQSATVDISAALSDLESAVRTAELRKDGSAVITDRLRTGAMPAMVRWTLVTPAKAEIREDGIHLFQGDVEMVLKAEGADIRYNIWDNRPDPAENPTAEFDDGIPQTVCGFTVIIPRQQEVALQTSLSRK